MSRPPSLIIINNAAAKARAAWPMVCERLDATKVEYESYKTTKPGDATVRTREALESGIKTIAVVGGDGTLSEVAQGFFAFNEDVSVLPAPINDEACLAIFPAGTGDDFARSHMGKRESLSKWIDIFIAHSRAISESNFRTVDVLFGKCDGFTTPFICINASTMGIGGDTARRVAAQGKFMRNFSGELRFAAAAVAALAHWRERRVRVTVDGNVFVDGPMNLVGVANALYAGGGMMLSPHARIDDGKLDVVTASGLNRRNIVRELMRIHKGGHVANPKVQVAQGERVTIETFASEDAMRIEVDGNVRGVTPVEFQVMPKALRFVV
jgi:YegS/Rv2252/BmrU family lipid kinase